VRKSDIAQMRRRLRQAREEAGHTTISLAKKIGVVHSTVVRWETDGPSEPRASDLIRIAEACDVSPAWLLVGVVGVLSAIQRSDNVTSSAQQA
jgi:transcriptional regulator with XRE-family HTH domain